MEIYYEEGRQSSMVEEEYGINHHVVF
jgi:hypothetical protein